MKRDSRRIRQLPAIPLLLAGMTACGSEPQTRVESRSARVDQPAYAVRETTITETYDATGIAEPVQRSMLSTRIMGNVLVVLVHEGDRVAAGQPLVRLDGRELESRRAQITAGLEAARAVHLEAATQAERFRRLYQDSAASRYQLDQAETGLARAEAGLKTAQAGLGELDAVGSYTEVRAPFAGLITRRMVDPGGFAAPGTPLIEIQDPSMLRVQVSVPPTVAATLRSGVPVDLQIEGRRASGRVEAIVPSPVGSVYRLNILVDNRRAGFLVGGSALAPIPTGQRTGILIPSRAVIREGDLTGVRVLTAEGSQLRWVRLGREFPVRPGSAQAEPLVEVLSGLAAGDALLPGET